MGKDGELVINKRTIYELVKGKEIGSKGKKITSRDMFDTMCKKRNFSHRLGGDIVDMVFDLHNIVDDDRGNERARFIGFLNSQQDEIIISNASVPKRQRLDMSLMQHQQLKRQSSKRRVSSTTKSSSITGKIRGFRE